MSKTAQKTDPSSGTTSRRRSREAARVATPASGRHGKAQLAVPEYKKWGGGYLGRKSDDNSLKRSSEEEWGTKSGCHSRDCGERYLPKTARDALSDEDYAKTSAKKRADSKKGKPFSRQPDEIGEKTAKHRSTGNSDPRAKRPNQNKDALRKQARVPHIQGRSSALKAELENAIRLAKH